MSRGDGSIIAALLGVGIVVSPLVSGRSGEAAPRVSEVMQHRALAAWPEVAGPRLAEPLPASAPASRSTARVIEGRWDLGSVADRPFDLIVVAGDRMVRRDRTFGLDGRPVLVHVSASWCEPCVEDFETFVALAGDAPRAVYVANEDVAGPAGLTNAFEALASRAEASSRAWPVGLELRADPASAWLARLGVETLPVTAVIDGRGTISMVIEGALDAELADRVRAHLGDSTWGGE